MARDVRDLPARTHPATRRDPPHDGGLRGLPEDRVTLGAPARVPELRTCRLLRLLAQPSRPRARRDDEPRRGALVRAGRGLALVLRGRDAGLSGPADASPPGGMVRRLARVATMWPPPTPGRTLAVPAATAGRAAVPRTEGEHAVHLHQASWQCRRQNPVLLERRRPHPLDPPRAGRRPRLGLGDTPPDP